MPRSSGNKKRFFLWQNALGNEMIHPSSSVRGLPEKEEAGTWCSSAKGLG